MVRGSPAANRWSNSLPRYSAPPTVPAFAALIVRDTGPGIPEHLRERVFDPFFRQRNDDRGCGLGLSIVQRIVHLHDGDMPEGGGLRVSVRLPATAGNSRALTRK